MAAPVAATAVLEKVGKAVSQDLVVIGGQWFREVTVGKGKKKRLVLMPVNWEVHVNPVSVGLGALTVGAALGFSWLAWNGLQSGFGTIIPGLKESDYWQGVAGKLSRGKAGTAPAALPPGSPADDKAARLAACLAGCLNEPNPVLRLACVAKCQLGL